MQQLEGGKQKLPKKMRDTVTELEKMAKDGQFKKDNSGLCQVFEEYLQKGQRVLEGIDA